MKRYLYIIVALCSSIVMSCTDGLKEGGFNREGEYLHAICISTEEASLIVSRIHSEEPADENIENVALFVFNADGTLYKKLFQQFEDGKAIVNMYLTDGAYVACAVCNAMDAEQIYNAVNSLDELKNLPLTLNNADEAYRGKYMMSGRSELHVDASTGSLTVKVSRMVAMQEVRIDFIPDDKKDEFMITTVKLHNLPKGAWILERTEGEDATKSSVNDWTYKSNPVEMRGYLFPMQELKVRDVAVTNGAKWSNEAKFHCLENRRGGIVPEGGTAPNDWHTVYWPGSKAYAEGGQTELLDVCRQTQKGILGRRMDVNGKVYGTDQVIPEGTAMKFENATYLTIEGVYRRFDHSTWNTTYTVFLGSDNYKDFNICRNTKYKTTVSIRSLERADTRVEADAVGNMVFSATKEILDAHCCVERAVIAAQSNWKAWVVDPDKTPWLELSKSPIYDHQRVGEAVDASHHASYRIEGSAGLDYVYIHVDEYLPHLKNPNENSRYSVREAKIAYQMENKPIQYFTIKQYPAQMAVLYMKFDEHTTKEVRDTFYIERILEEKHMSWGMEKYWSVTTDELIASGRWDGLFTTRRLYHVALYGDRWGDPAYKDGTIPFDTALGYVVNKNRDRDGNGKIDEDEIMWYWPAVKEMRCLREAINNGTLNFESSDDIFHCSTPSSADPDPDAITTGFSYYVKMADGKSWVGPRDRLYNVICMRRKNNEWHGPAGDDVNLEVKVETGWLPDEEVVMPIK